MKRRNALVLSGGGTKGAVEVGAAWQLYGAHRLDPTMFVGTSVGAINATKLAEGTAYPLSGKLDLPMSVSGLEGLWSIWRYLRSGVDMMWPTYELQNVMVDLPIDVQHGGAEGFHSLESSLLTQGIVALVVPVFGPIIAGITIMDLIGDVKNALAGDTLSYLKPIRDFLNDANVVDLRRVGEHLRSVLGADASVGLVVNYVDSYTGETRYASLMLEQSGTNDDAQATILDANLRAVGLAPISWTDAVLAAAAIPAVISDVKLHAATAYDGGVREVTALSPALAGHGHPTVIAITGPAYPYRGFSPGHGAPSLGRPGKETMNLPEHGVRAVDVMVDQIMAWEEQPRRNVERKGLWHIRPDVDVLGTFTVVPARIRCGARYGAELAFALCDPSVRNLGARVHLRQLATAKAFALGCAISHQQELEDEVVGDVVKYADRRFMTWSGAEEEDPADHFDKPEPSGYPAGGTLYFHFDGYSMPAEVGPLWGQAQWIEARLQPFLGDAPMPPDTELPSPWFDLGDRRIHPGNDDSSITINGQPVSAAGKWAQAAVDRLRRSPTMPAVTPQGGDSVWASANEQHWMWDGGTGSLKLSQRGVLSSEYPRSTLVALNDGHGVTGSDALHFLSDEYSITYGQFVTLTTCVGGVARRFPRSAFVSHTAAWEADEVEIHPEANRSVLGATSVGLPYGLSGGMLDLVLDGPVGSGPDRVLLLPDSVARSLGLERSELPCTGMPSATWWDNGRRRISILLAVPLHGEVVVSLLDEALVPKEAVRVSFGANTEVLEVAIGQVRLGGLDQVLLMARVATDSTIEIRQTIIGGAAGAWAYSPPEVVSTPDERVAAGPCFVQRRDGSIDAIYARTADTEEPAFEEVLMNGRDGKWPQRVSRAAVGTNRSGATVGANPVRFGLTQLSDGREVESLLAREVYLNDGSATVLLETATGPGAYGVPSAISVTRQTRTILHQ